MVKCPECGNRLVKGFKDKPEQIACPACNWIFPADRDEALAWVRACDDLELLRGLATVELRQAVKRAAIRRVLTLERRDD